MKDWYRQLNTEFKVAVWSLIIISGLVICLIPCYFFSLMEIPNGIALGGMVGIIIYLLFGLFGKKDDPKKAMILTIILIVVKLIVIGGLLFLVGWLYYSLGMKAFNIFAVAGGYLIPLVIYIILVRKEKVSGNS